MNMPSTSFIPASQSIPAAVTAKSATAYRTISEAADLLGVPQHVLRFWETKFPQIRPMKRSGGRRYYRPQDLVLLQTIQNLLYDQGYTIKGVQRLLKARRNPAELADMDKAALHSASGESLDLDQLVSEITATAAELEFSPPDLFASAAEVMAELPEISREIPAHLPEGPASLMAAGIEAGRPLPVILENLNNGIQLVNLTAELDTAEQGGLVIEQRLRLECLLEELLALKAEFL